LMLAAGTTLTSERGDTVSDPVFVAAPAVAVTVAVVEVETYAVDMVNVACVAPEGTTTVAGAITAGDELVRVTVVPAGGAIPLSVTRLVLPVQPELAVVMANESVCRSGGATVTLAVLVTPPAVAEIVALPVEETTAGVMSNDTVIWPAGTTTDVGTLTIPGAEDVSVTAIPPAGAVALNLTLLPLPAFR
jgi:hypothetical protein